MPTDKFCNIINTNKKETAQAVRKKRYSQPEVLEGVKYLIMETYVECMVKRKKNGGLVALKVLLIVLTVLFFLLGMGSIIFLIVAIAAGVGAYFVSLNSSLEYEYLYVDKQLTVDKIMAQTKRKKVDTLDLERMEILAPIKSWHLDDYKNRQLKTVDYSTGVEEKPDRRYCLIYNGEKRVTFEPNEAMVTAIKSIAPRKVFTD